MSEQYLDTLYQDFEIKLNSINTYLKRLNDSAGSINQTSKEWAYDLKKKYEAVKNFNTNKPKSVPTTHFSIELPPDANDAYTTAEKEIKRIDNAINNSSQQINHIFQKSQKDLQFLVQSYQDLQNIINKIYDTWSSIIELEQE
jgi:DNA repair exonuclease SbcCD ATPase subunit